MDLPDTRRMLHNLIKDQEFTGHRVVRLTVSPEMADVVRKAASEHDAFRDVTVEVNPKTRGGVLEASLVRDDRMVHAHLVQEPVALKATENLIMSALRDAAVKKPRRIKRLPGSRVAPVLRFVFSRRTYERVFSQMIEDVQCEYRDAVIAGDMRLARLRHVQFWTALPVVCALLALTSTAKKVYDLWKSSIG
jgi:hypothetical protein